MIPKMAYAMGSSSPVFGVVAEVGFELVFVEVAELLFEPLLPDFVAPLPASLSLPALSPVFELELELEELEEPEPQPARPSRVTAAVPEAIPKKPRRET